MTRFAVHVFVPDGLGSSVLEFSVTVEAALASGAVALAEADWPAATAFQVIRLEESG